METFDTYEAAEAALPDENHLVSGARIDGHRTYWVTGPDDDVRAQAFEVKNGRAPDEHEVILSRLTRQLEEDVIKRA